MSGGLYSSIAPMYDKANADIDYGAWADFIEAAFSRYLRCKPAEILDLACGTGAMTLELAKRGYDMTALDLSVEMLNLAREKLSNAGVTDVLLLNQDMRAIDLYGTVGAAVCCLDSVNYLTSTDGLRKCFKGIHMFTEPGGLFIFDVNTPRKFREIYADNAYVYEDDSRYTVWQNSFVEKTGLCTFTLDSFSLKRDGSYTRVSEQQRERSYSRTEIETALTECGMKLCAVTGGYDFRPASDSDMRWYFIAKVIK